MFLSVTSKENTWIIDTETSDHMTRDSNKLQTSHPSSQQVIFIANENTCNVRGEGFVELSSTLTLDIILVVPSLPNNLLFVSQITLSLNCTVTFWPLFFIFQDILTRKTLGYGVKRGKLYYLELTKNVVHKFGWAFRRSRVEKAKEKIWLWHKRLGHISFDYFKTLRPSLFSDLGVLDFQCNICELAKSHRIPYVSSLNNCSEPFIVIHSNIWGPTKVPSISKARYFITFIDECTRMT